MPMTGPAPCPTALRDATRNALICAVANKGDFVAARHWLEDAKKEGNHEIAPPKGETIAKL